MRRIQIDVGAEFDDRRKTRRAGPSGVVDPIDTLVGAFDGDPVDELDEAIYG